MTLYIPPIQLPSELLSATWSTWSRKLTSPMSRRSSEPHLQLPPINQPSCSSRLPPFQDSFPDMRQPFAQLDNFQMDKPSPPFVDWLDISQKQTSAHFIAEKTCEMICYLWFAKSPSTRHSPPFLSRSSSETTALQLSASRTFVQFMQKLLETTQVSHSVIVLSLHYIYRLKERNHLSSGQPGSEFRIAVASLMMANKFLDDNTYTNKTWSEVSGIELADINKMEREFLQGVDFGLYVDQSTYESWLNLLKGLVMAKERDSRRYRKSRRIHSNSRQATVPSSVQPQRHYSSRHRTHSHRARSTSPASRSSAYPFSFAMSTAPTQQVPSNADYSPTPRPGSKRSANDAFSPTSASFPEPRLLKRPTGISLDIPDYRASSNSSSSSPLESLQSFSKMSLGTSPSVPSSASAWTSSNSNNVPHTLIAPYRAEERRPAAVPQNLYFYSLACSPMENEEESRWRKTRLRSYQPPQPTSVPYCPPRLHYPMDVQSASTSPHDVHMSAPPSSLPHFHETLWSRQHTSPYTTRHDHTHKVSDTGGQGHLETLQESPVPSAPFANAGPPGIHFYRESPARTYDWSRGRRL